MTAAAATPVAVVIASPLAGCLMYLPLLLSHESSGGCSAAESVTESLCTIISDEILGKVQNL